MSNRVTGSNLHPRESTKKNTQKKGGLRIYRCHEKRARRGKERIKTAPLELGHQTGEFTEPACSDQEKRDKKRGAGTKLTKRRDVQTARKENTSAIYERKSS